MMGDPLDPRNADKVKHVIKDFKSGNALHPQESLLEHHWGFCTHYGPKLHMDQLFPTSFISDVKVELFVNEVIQDEQFGSRMGHSTEHQVR